MVEKNKRGDFSLPNLPYTIISIDLGETTGVASYELLSRALRCTATQHFQQLFPLLVLLRPNEILLERFPGKHALDYSIEIAYRQLAMKSILISPSEWKPFMQTKKKKFDHAETQHEKDAINMLRYYMITTLGRDI